VGAFASCNFVLIWDKLVSAVPSNHHFSNISESEFISAVRDPDVRADEPTVDEVIQAIKKLQNAMLH